MVKNSTTQQQLENIAHSILLMNPTQATIYDWASVEDEFERLAKEITDENVILKFGTIEECRKFCELITRASCKLYLLVWFPLITDFMICIGINYLYARSNRESIVVSCATALTECHECAGWYIDSREDIVVVNISRLNEKPPIPPLDIVTDIRLLYQQNKCGDFPLTLEQLIATLPEERRKQIPRPIIH